MKMIFVNLPVKDLKKSMDFFKKLGFSFNPQFTNDEAACMVISDSIYSMLITHERYKSFTPKQIADSAKSSEVLVALSFDSRAEVDKVAEAALSGGATQARPVEDHGFMYTRAINDLDGHTWEMFWMDPKAVK